MKEVTAPRYESIYKCPRCASRVVPNCVDNIQVDPLHCMDCGWTEGDWLFTPEFTPCDREFGMGLGAILKPTGYVWRGLSVLLFRWWLSIGWKQRDVIVDHDSLYGEPEGE